MCHRSVIHVTRDTTWHGLWHQWWRPEWAWRLLQPNCSFLYCISSSLWYWYVLQVVGNKARVVLCSSVLSTPSPCYLAALSLHSEWHLLMDMVASNSVLHALSARYVTPFSDWFYLNCSPSLDCPHPVIPTVPTCCFNTGSTTFLIPLGQNAQLASSSWVGGLLCTLSSSALNRMLSQ